MEQQNSATESDNQGVRFPPPLVYLITLLIGAVINRFIPLHIIPDSLAAWIGGVLVLFAVIITIPTFREFGKANTTARHDRPVTTLVTTGIYRYSRNPNYIAMSMLFFGIGVWLNDVWIVVLCLFVLAWISAQVVPSEEQYLLGRFGQEYTDYQARVRRWI